METFDGDSNVIRICNKRYLNVLFGQVIKFKLATCGASLTKAELQDKLSTDEEFHTNLLAEYNREDIYNEHVWSDIVDFQDAGEFEHIPCNSWRKSDAKLKATLDGVILRSPEYR